MNTQKSAPPSQEQATQHWQEVHANIRSLTVAWEVVNLLDAHPELRAKHGALYILAKTRVRKSQQWFKVRRAIWGCCKKTCNWIFGSISGLLATATAVEPETPKHCPSIEGLPPITL